MSCPEGYSRTSATDDNCVRDCALGPVDVYPDGAYYPIADLCWPVCPALSIDKGSACAKTYIGRTDLNWQTDVNIRFDNRRRRDPNNRQNFLGDVVSNVAGCPPNYTAFRSASETYTDGSAAVKCFYNCPDTGDATQTQLNEMGQCLVDVCGANEIGGGSFEYATPFSGDNTYRDNSGETFTGEALTTVCNRGSALASNTTDYRVTRVFGTGNDAASCPNGKRAEFFKDLTLSSWTSVQDAQGIAVTDPNYEYYYTCTTQCNSDGSNTNKRYNDFCAPDCPDSGDIAFIAAALGNQAPFYNSVVNPPNLRAQSRCLKKLAANGTGSLTSLPSVAPPDAPAGGCANAKRWMLATDSDPATQTAWRSNQLLGDSLYMYDNNSTPAYPNNTACVPSSVCGTNFVKGFLENPVPSGGTQRTVTVFCGKTDNPPNFTDDPVFSNVWQRYMFFVDPATTLASSCGPGLSLMGQSNFVKDNTDGVGMGEGIGYAYEIPPSPFVRAQATNAYTVSQDGVDSSYVYGEIVGVDIDRIEYLTPSGQPIINPSDATSLSQPNPRSGYLIGPFYRCIQSHTVNPGNSGLPATTQSYPNAYWTLPSGVIQKPMYAQDPSVALISSSPYWEVVNIPTSIDIDNLRPAGPISITSKLNFKQELCSAQNGDISSFCPPICLSRCPGTNMPPSNSDVYGLPPSTSYTFFEIDRAEGGVSSVRYDIKPLDGLSPLQSQAGIYEYVFELNGTTPTAVCYPRCGSSALYSGTSNLCISKTAPVDNNVVPGFSWCPPVVDSEGRTDPLSIAKSNVQNIAPTNPQTNYAADPPIIGIPWNNICLSPCPNGMMISNDPPQDKCVTKCSLDGRFIDNGPDCLKIPYQRISSDPNSQTIEENVMEVEQAYASTASSVSKIALAGGPSSLFGGILIVVAVCALITIILLVLQYQAGRLSSLK